MTFVKSWRFMFVTLGLALLMLLGVGLRANPASATTYPNASCIKTMLPMYSPNMWAASPVPNLAVANWGSDTQNSGAGGPGLARVAANATTINNEKAAGSKVLGYVWTNYGNQTAGYTIADIEKQMQQWQQWYGVTTFFLDGVPTATANEPEYATLETYAKSLNVNAKDYLNMGAYPAASSWVAGGTNGDYFLVWENSTNPTTPPSWFSNYSPTKFGMIVHDVTTSAAMVTSLNAIEAAHAGWGLITQDGTYQNVPSYWSTEVTDAKNGTGC